MQNLLRARNLTRRLATTSNNFNKNVENWKNHPDKIEKDKFLASKKALFANASDSDEHASLLVPKTPNKQELFHPFLLPENVKEQELPLSYRRFGPLGWGPISMVSRFLRKYWMDQKYLGDYDNFIEHQKLDPEKRKKQVITLTCHQSTIDDPFIIATWFPLWNYFFANSKLPWSIAGHNVLFTTEFKNWFFSHGRAGPAIRGQGINQRTMNFLSQRRSVEDGFFANFYPEGTCNMFKENMPMKWGAARLMLESIDDGRPSMEIRIVWHEGLEDFISPWRVDDHKIMDYPPQLQKKHNVTFNISDGYNFDLLIKTMRKRRERRPDLVQFNERPGKMALSQKLLEKYKEDDLAACEERQAIMDLVAKLFDEFRQKTLKLHYERPPSKVYLKI